VTALVGVLAVIALVGWIRVLALSRYIVGMKYRLAGGDCWYEICVLPAGHQGMHRD
jgi:hypothetical protein